MNPTDSLNHLATAANCIRKAIAALEKVDAPEPREYARKLREILFQDNGAAGLDVYIDVLVKQSDELITVREASRITGRTLSHLSQMIKRGDLASIDDLTEPNPTRRTRLIRSEVERIKPKRKVS